MRRAASAWTGILAVFTMWVAVTVASMDARGPDQQEGVIRPQPRAVTAPPAPIPPATPAHAALVTGATGKFKSTLANGQPAAGYTGDTVCLECHEAQGAISKTPHGRANNPRTPMANSGCESCHGPGQAHVDDDDKGKILRFGDTKTDARVGNETCLSCHTRGAHALWEGSSHDSRNLACVSCHSVHSPKSFENQLKAETQTDLCQSCHRQQAAKMRRASHMPVTEGKMECASCHNPHGATNVKLLKVGNWINESCTSCHAEKRGPFLHEHAAGRENCVSCHDPHGSPHDRMLVAKLPMLCQRCHNHTRHPPTVYDQAQLNNRSNRLIGRACVNCHSNIHGSNHPAGVTFLR